MIHGDRHFIDMSSSPLKCWALYCDKQLFSCTIGLYYIHFIWIYTNISIYVEIMNNCIHALHPMPPCLFCNTCKLKKLHHLIIAKCRCMNELVMISGIVNLAQIQEHVIQVLAWNLLTSLFPLPKTTISQSPGKCIANYLQWKQGMSSPLWKL